MLPPDKGELKVTEVINRPYVALSVNIVVIISAAIWVGSLTASLKERLTYVGASIVDLRTQISQANSATSEMHKIFVELAIKQAVNAEEIARLRTDFDFRKDETSKQLQRLWEETRRISEYLLDKPRPGLEPIPPRSPFLRQKAEANG